MQQKQAVKIWCGIAIGIALKSQVCFAITDRTKEHCRTLSQTAEAVMYERQSGTAMYTLMDSLKFEGTIQDKFANMLVEDQIKEAYATPRYTSKSKITKTVQNFRDRWYIECIKYEWY
jgi:hypothetical protein